MVNQDWWNRHHVINTMYEKNNPSFCCSAGVGHYLVKHCPILIIFGRCLTFLDTNLKCELKWSCEAGGFTWRSQVGAMPIPIPHPTNLALFGHKITLYRFNQGGGSYYYRGLKSEQRAEPSCPLTLTTASSSVAGPVRAPGCKNRPAPFPDWMSYKGTKPGCLSIIS